MRCSRQTRLCRSTRRVGGEGGEDGVERGEGLGVASGRARRTVTRCKATCESAADSGRLEPVRLAVWRNGRRVEEGTRARRGGQATLWHLTCNQVRVCMVRSRPCTLPRRARGLAKGFGAGERAMSSRGDEDESGAAKTWGATALARGGRGGVSGKQQMLDWLSKGACGGREREGAAGGGRGDDEVRLLASRAIAAPQTSMLCAQLCRRAAIEASLRPGPAVATRPPPPPRPPPGSCAASSGSWNRWIRLT